MNDARTRFTGKEVMERGASVHTNVEPLEPLIAPSAHQNPLYRHPTMDGFNPMHESCS